MVKTSSTMLDHSSTPPSLKGGSQWQPASKGPLWLLAELTYRCPLRCFYCSNPLELGRRADELTTEQWLTVIRDARALGAVQLGFSGGEPLVRPDLELLVKEARSLGYYSNLITSGIGLSEPRLQALKEAGLDHVQLSFQASDTETNNFIGGGPTFARKLRAAAVIKRLGYPMVLNVVLHRHNIDDVRAVIELAESLEADYLELASVQYDGWALLNRGYLMPSLEQVERAENVVNEWRATSAKAMKVFYVVPDYHAGRPKPCSNGWGTTLMVVTPDGLALPCHGARRLSHLGFPKVQDMSLIDIWERSTAFNTYRGEEWMQPPCRTCPERKKDFGGCRCQAFALTGDAANADPVCAKSPHHHIVAKAARADSHMTATPIARGANFEENGFGKPSVPSPQL